MKEDTDWFKVVFEYAERFPYRKVKDIGLEFSFDIADTLFKNLVDDGWYCVTPSDSDACVFTKFGKVFKYGSGVGIRTVPQHILLRLLSEGKEDLI